MEQLVIRQVQTSVGGDVCGRISLTWEEVSVSYNLFCRSGYTGKYKIWQAWDFHWWSSG